MTTRFALCDCGSGLEREPMYDGYDIFLTYVCEQCRERKLAKFRPDILTQYDTDEPIEPDHDDNVVRFPLYQWEE